jgi:hypothetical protein
MPWIGSTSMFGMLRAASEVDINLGAADDQRVGQAERAKVTEQSLGLGFGSDQRCR